jgi:hypothetical protein
LTRAAEQQLEQSGAASSSVVPLFNDPKEQRGRLVMLEGTARRVVRVAVDAETAARFGFDHYYNLFLVTDDSQGNPLVFCVRWLPEGMPLGDGPGYGERVRVAGFFLKSWAYRPHAAAQTGGPEDGLKPRLQLAPLLIGREPVWYPQQQPAANWLLGLILGGLFALLLLGIWLALWWYGRADKRFFDRTVAKVYGHGLGAPRSELDTTPLKHGAPDAPTQDNRTNHETNEI